MIASRHGGVAVDHPAVFALDRDLDFEAVQTVLFLHREDGALDRDALVSDRERLRSGLLSGTLGLDFRAAHDAADEHPEVVHLLLADRAVLDQLADDIDDGHVAGAAVGDLAAEDVEGEGDVLQFENGLRLALARLVLEDVAALNPEGIRVEVEHLLGAIEAAVDVTVRGDVKEDGIVDAVSATDVAVAPMIVAAELGPGLFTVAVERLTLGQNEGDGPEILDLLMAVSHEFVVSRDNHGRAVDVSALAHGGILANRGQMSIEKSVW